MEWKQQLAFYTSESGRCCFGRWAIARPVQEKCRRRATVTPLAGRITGIPGKAQVSALRHVISSAELLCREDKTILMFLSWNVAGCLLHAFADAFNWVGFVAEVSALIVGRCILPAEIGRSSHNELRMLNACLKFCSSTYGKVIFDQCEFLSGLPTTLTTT